MIYRIATAEEWERAQASGRYAGNPDDARDGFLHFSTRAQVRGTFEKHYAGKRDLVILTVDPAKLPKQLVWERSRGGALFPHLYDALPVEAVSEITFLGAGLDGAPILPDFFAL
ncbi:MAG: DUF952 domain-containing protein [Caulobacterales bacterium]